MFLNQNKLLFRKYIIRYLRDSESLRSKTINLNKDAPLFILNRNYSDKLTDDIFNQQKDETKITSELASSSGSVDTVNEPNSDPFKTVREEELMRVRDDFLGQDTHISDIFSSTQNKETKRDRIFQTEKYGMRFDNSEAKPSFKNGSDLIKRIGTNDGSIFQKAEFDMRQTSDKSKTKLSSKNGSDLVRQAKQVFQLVGCDANVLDATSLLSAVKHLILILEEQNWEKDELNEFLLSEEYAFLIGRFIIFHRAMDPFSLKEIVKFLELLQLPKSDSVMRQVYKAMRENTTDYSSLDEGSGDKKNNVFGTMRIPSIFETGSEHSKFLPRKISKSGTDEFTNKEIIKALSEACEVEFHQITVDYLIEYFEILKRLQLDPKKTKLKHGLYDILLFLSKKEDFKLHLPKLFSLYIETVHTEKLKPSRKALEFLFQKLAKASKDKFFTDDQMIEILSDSRNIIFSDISPKVLLHYFEILEEIDMTDEEAKKVRLKYDVRDIITFFSKEDACKADLMHHLPEIFLVYAKLVSSRKLKFFKKAVSSMLEEAIKYEETLDKHFMILKALNVLETTDFSYLQMVLKKSLERPDVLENFENFEVLLDALKYSHLTGCFHQLKNLDVLESFIKDMKFLKDEDERETIGKDRLEAITRNLSFLGLCPDFLLLPTTSQEIKETEVFEEHSQISDKPFHMFENSEKSQIDSLSDKEIFENLSEASLISVNGATPTFLINYYKLLNKINPDHPQLKEVALNDKLYDFVARNCIKEKEFIREIPSFLPLYAKAVADGKEKFCKKLVDEMVEEVMENEEGTIEDHFLTIDALNLMNVFNAPYLQFIVKEILEDPKIIAESTRNLQIFLESLAISDFPSQNRNQWPFLKSFIKDLAILNDENIWKKASLNELLDIVKNLALFGIYSDPLLTYTSKLVNDNPVEDSKLWNKLLILNQSIGTLHPSLKQTFLNPTTLAKVDRWCSEDDTISKSNWFAQDVKANLELVKKDEHIILTNCYTKLGLKIDLVLALNELNRLFSFQEFLRQPKKFFIDDISISLPENYQLIFLCLFQKEDYLGDSSQLSPLAQLKLKAFEAMGYTAVPILKSEWDSVENSEKGSYFWKKIMEKNSCNIPEDMLERAREPLFID